MLILRYVFLIGLFFPLYVYADDIRATAVQMAGSDSFILTTGETVRLGGIVTPARHEPLGPEAQSALSALVLHQQVQLSFDADARDRYQRKVAQVYLTDGRWVQEAMLRAGWAMLYHVEDIDNALLPKMEEAERAAQKAKRGIWASPYWRVITPEETSQYINHYKIVEGTIVSIHPWHDNIYINFSEEWKGHFALFISKKVADAFALDTLQALVGKTVRIRGWVRYHNAPTMDITQPEQIEAE